VTPQTTSFAQGPSFFGRAALLFVPALFLAPGSFCFATSQIPTFLGRNQRLPLGEQLKNTPLIYPTAGIAMSLFDRALPI
jgi:hypothetical protein